MPRRRDEDCSPCVIDPTGNKNGDEYFRSLERQIKNPAMDKFYKDFLAGKHPGIKVRHETVDGVVYEVPCENKSKKRGEVILIPKG